MKLENLQYVSELHLPVAFTVYRVQRAAFAASLKEEQQNWGAFIRQHNIQPD